MGDSKGICNKLNNYVTKEQAKKIAEKYDKSKIESINFNGLKKKNSLDGSHPTLFLIPMFVGIFVVLLNCLLLFVVQPKVEENIYVANQMEMEFSNYNKILEGYDLTSGEQLDNSLGNLSYKLEQLKKDRDAFVLAYNGCEKEKESLQKTDEKLKEIDEELEKAETTETRKKELQKQKETLQKEKEDSFEKIADYITKYQTAYSDFFAKIESFNIEENYAKNKIVILSFNDYVKSLNHENYFGVSEKTFDKVVNSVGIETKFKDLESEVNWVFEENIFDYQLYDAQMELEKEDFENYSLIMENIFKPGEYIIAFNSIVLSVKNDLDMLGIRTQIGRRIYDDICLGLDIVALVTTIAYIIYLFIVNAIKNSKENYDNILKMIG